VKPKVLVISERLAVRESACVLLGTMGCQWVVASRIEDAMAGFETEKPSAAVLDLPSGVSDPGSMGHDFSELLSLLQGKLVVLTDETISREIGDLEKKYSIPFVQRDRLTADLWLCLSAVLFSQPTIRRITQTARLVLDTFLQPRPVGVRFSPRTDLRQLVYETDHFTADISLEHLAGSTRTTASGQVMRDIDSRVPLNGAPVVIRGERGPLELKMTNQSGEFAFEFERERKITFEIEVNYGHWITIALPVLQWDVAANAGDD
jgi:hypothetical protein